MASLSRLVATACLIALAATACAPDESPQPADLETTRAAIGGTSVSTDAASYSAGSTITVTYSGMPGNLQDWIAIAPAGSANTSYVAYVLTNGLTSGTATFAVPTAGTYVARAFPNNTYALLAESASFTASGPTIGTDKTSYVTGETITVSYAGLPGNADDWIAIATAGSANTSYVKYAVTGGLTSGTATFTVSSGGSYVARAFPHNTYNLLAQSSTFTVAGGTTITTDKSSYSTGAAITVTYSGMPGNAGDWIAIAQAGSANTSYWTYVSTGRKTSGTFVFTAPTTTGSYVARAFPNNTYNLIAQSSTFTVTPGPTVATDKSSYSTGETITVTYTGLPGNPDDWIALAQAGSANTSYLKYALTGGQTSGTATFTLPTGGSYVARVFPHNTFNLLAQSSPFTVTDVSITTDKSTYAPGETITVAYQGMPGYADDWVAIATNGSANNSYVKFASTGGQHSGTLTFTLAAGGTYVARSFPHNTFNLLVQSSPFTVDANAPTISTNKTSYAPGETITVTYSGMPGNTSDWIAIAAPGSANTSYVKYASTGGSTSGTVTFTLATGGTYVARSFPNNTYNLLVQSQSFFVSNPAPVTVNTNKSSYAPNETITVAFSGMPSNAQDWIAIASNGSSNTSYVKYASTGGLTSGTVTFTVSTAGTYVARAFPNNTYNLLAQSQSFTVTSGRRALSFAAVRSRAITGPSGLASADFNGDGKRDLAVTTASNGVAVMLGNGDGTFQAETYIGVGLDAVLAGDFNGDGKADLASINGGTNTLAIFRGNGDGTFQAALTSTIAGAPTKLVTGDWNGDGKLDLAVTSPGNNSVSVLLGNGDATFQTGTPLAPTGPTSVTPGDYDGDAKADLVVAKYNQMAHTGTITLYQGSGTGTFTTGQTYSTGSDLVRVAPGDLNGDGKLDVVAFGFDVRIFLGNGNGTLQTAVVAAPGLGARDLWIGDLNGDGKVDLAISVDRGLQVHLGNGDGTFKAGVLYGINGDGGALARGDWNGDGKVDFVVAAGVDISTGRGGNSVSTFLGNGDGTFQGARLYPTGQPLSDQAFGVVTGDWNGDLVMDVATVRGTCCGAGAIDVFLGNPGGTLGPAVSYPAGTSVGEITTADFNGDGRADMAVTNKTSPATVTILLGNGNGTFQAGMSYGALYNPVSLQHADLNGDGKVDLVMSGRATSSGSLPGVTVLLGNGNGTFGAANNYTVVSAGTGSLAVGDWNGDGKLDCAASDNVSTINVLLGDGTGGLTFAWALSTPVQPDGSRFSALVTGDWNGDGKADLFATRTSHGVASSYLGIGDGHFQSGLDAPADGGGFALVADFDLDGKMDLAMTGNDRIKVLLGNGDGTFQAPAFFATTAQPVQLAVGDANGDGLPDLLAFDNFDVVIGVLLNTSH